ncbi:MAG TPA: VOC family protein [Lacunisphaera sp.]|nr:VOC family protein [Lacunisphaera sp.]
MNQTVSSTPPLPVNRSMPGCSVIPVLAYPDVRAAVEWLGQAFGFTERLRIGDHRAQLSFNGGAVVITGPAKAATDATHAVLVRVADVDSHHERAKKCGAMIMHVPADHRYGERQYSATDPGGHIWTFSQTIADADPRTWGGELQE